MKTASALSHLECPRCGSRLSAREIHHLCTCGAPLLARYDLAKARETLTPAALLSPLGPHPQRAGLMAPLSRRRDLWRYEEVLPLGDDRHRLALGEGGTPLTPAKRLSARLGLSRLFIKDESANATGSFKARGLAVAISMAKELGVREVAIPSAGNAGGALAAYAAAAGMTAHVVMPKDAPRANVVECLAYGADVRFVDGLITDAGRLVAELSKVNGWYDVSTLKEPYRIEGKKTMGYELFEQLGGRLPDVILYPTGGGTGMVGMWKAFDEMEKLGFIDDRRPRMVSVQASGCAPIVRAFERGEETAPLWENAHTLASGLRVPRAIGDFLILRAVRESRGTAVAVDDDDIVRAVRDVASCEGIFAAPEGGACLVALEKLIERGFVGRDEIVVLFNTGTGLKYLESLSAIA